MSSCNGVSLLDSWKSGDGGTAAPAGYRGHRRTIVVIDCASHSYTQRPDLPYRPVEGLCSDCSAYQSAICTLRGRFPLSTVGGTFAKESRRDKWSFGTTGIRYPEHMGLENSISKPRKLPTCTADQKAKLSTDVIGSTLRVRFTPLAPYSTGLNDIIHDGKLIWGNTATFNIAADTGQSAGRLAVALTRLWYGIWAGLLPKWLTNFRGSDMLLPRHHICVLVYVATWSRWWNGANNQPRVYSICIKKSETGKCGTHATKQIGLNNDLPLCLKKDAYNMVFAAGGLDVGTISGGISFIQLPVLVIRTTEFAGQ